MMAVSNELVTWLREQIEVTKRAASPKILLAGGTWHIDNEHWEAGTGIMDAAERPIAVAIGDCAAAHIAWHDPLSVLARCEAELAILDEHGPGKYGDACRCCYGTLAYPCQTVRLVGSGYRHRPGYLREWAPPAQET